MLVVAATTVLLVVGIKETARFNDMIVGVKVAIVLAFIAAGIGFVRKANLHPFLPPNPEEFQSFGHFVKNFGNFGWTGVFRAAGVVFFAYIGFDSVSTTAQEAKNPQRDMPIGILGTLLICTILYMAVAFVLTGIVPYKGLDVPDPIAVGVDRIGFAWLSVAVKVGAILGPELGDPRLAAGPAADLLLDGEGRALPPVRREDPPEVPDPSHHHDDHRRSSRDRRRRARADARRRRTGLDRDAVRVRGRQRGVLVLRVREPDLDRAFRTPAVWLTAPLGVLSCVLLMATLAVRHLAPAGRLDGDRHGHLLRFYGRHHSKLGNPELGTATLSLTVDRSGRPIRARTIRRHGRLRRPAPSRTPTPSRPAAGRLDPVGHARATSPASRRAGAGRPLARGVSPA